MICDFFQITYEFAFIILFITIFFFTVGSQIERIIIQRQLQRLVDGMTEALERNVLRQISTINLQERLKQIIQTSELPSKYTSSNNSLYIGYLIMYIIFIIALSGVYLGYRNKFDIRLGKIILKTVVLLILVGCYEFYFVTTYVTKYAPILPSEINSIMQTVIQDKFGAIDDSFLINK